MAGQSVTGARLGVDIGGEARLMPGNLPAVIRGTPAGAAGVRSGDCAAAQRWRALCLTGGRGVATGPSGPCT